MISLCIQELAEIIGGRLHLGVMPPLGGGLEPIGRVVVNMCDVQPGDVFLATDTAEHDATARADDAFARGALGVVAAGRRVEPWAGKFSVVVQDASRALWQLAAWSRRRFLGQFITVAGSTGRSATTMMIDAVLGERFMGMSFAQDVTCGLKLPLSMLALDESHDFAVLEYTAGQLSQVGALSHLCCPDVAVINCVAAEGTPVGDLAGKLEMLEALPDDGWVVLNGDIPPMCELARCLDGRALLVGRCPHCDVVASDVCSRSGELSFTADGVRLQVPALGRRHLHSALAAFAVGRIMNMSPNEVVVALSRFRRPPVCSRERQMDGVVDGPRHGTSSLPEAA